MDDSLHVAAATPTSPQVRVDAPITVEPDEPDEAVGYGLAEVIGIADGDARHWDTYRTCAFVETPDGLAINETCDECFGVVLDLAELDRLIEFLQGQRERIVATVTGPSTLLAGGIVGGDREFEPPGV